MKKKLVIILNDNITDIVKKGEIVERYYNPSNYFDEIHFILINQKKINANKIKKMTGNAKLYIYTFNFNQIEKFFFIFAPLIIKKKLGKIFFIIKKISPQIVRCYNLNFAIFLASKIKKKIQVPYIISLHFDLKDFLNKKISFVKKILFLIIKNKINNILRASYKLMPVYSSASNYIKDLKLKNYVICYNFIGNIEPGNLRKSKKIFNLICTNRQIEGKFPINIIKAVSSLTQVRLTLVGNGNYHQKLRHYVRERKIGKRVKFIKNLENQKYLKLLKNNHALILHSDYQEFGKSVIEAMSLKKPIIINKPRNSIQELNDSYCLMNLNDKAGYKNSIIQLIKDNKLANKLGRNGYKIYKKKYESKKMETQQSLIYKSLIENKFTK